MNEQQVNNASALLTDYWNIVRWINSKVLAQQLNRTKDNAQDYDVEHIRIRTTNG